MSYRDEIRSLNDNFEIGSDIYSLSQYIEGISGRYSGEWYMRYLLIIKYFANLYQIKGDKELERLSVHYIRAAIEFGKIGVSKINGKWVVLHIAKIDYNDDLTVKEVQVHLYKKGITYSKDTKPIRLKGDNIAILNFNYLSLPLIFFWKDVLNNIIRLKDAALTGSIASIKKFHRRISHNDSNIVNLETQSYIDTKTPYIITIDNPSGYYNLNTETVSQEELSRVRNISSNRIDIATSIGDTSYLWDNLKNYMDFEYLQLGVRLNTNKKNERNIAGEVRAETAMFDIQDQDFLTQLEIFKQELSDKFNCEIEIQDLIKNLDKEDKLLQYGYTNENDTEVSIPED